MRRRAFLAGLSLLTVAPVSSRGASQTSKSIGWLTFTGAGESDFIGDTMTALEELGWKRGSNINLVRRVPTTAREIQGDAEELVKLRPNVIVTNGEGPTSTILALSKTQPVMFYNTYDPVAAGLVQSQARPGGQATGFVAYPVLLAQSWVQLMQEMVPGLKRVAVVRETSIAASVPLQEAIRSVAAGRGIEVVTWPAADVDVLERALKDFHGTTPSAAIVLPDPITLRIRREFTQYAHREKVPTMFWYSDAVRANAMMSYGPDRSLWPKTLARCLDRLLRGTPPSSIPVEEPVRYELAINRFIAKQIGLEIPISLSVQADLLIE
jgi:putative ABC transport system substrate-binding protein